MQGGEVGGVGNEIPMPQPNPGSGPELEMEASVPVTGPNGRRLWSRGRRERKKEGENDNRETRWGGRAQSREKIAPFEGAGHLTSLETSRARLQLNLKKCSRHLGRVDCATF